MTILYYAKFLFTLIKHKYFVLTEGVIYGVPFLSVLFHDCDKMSPFYWKQYAASVAPDFLGIKREYDKVIKDHVQSRKHHWEYWKGRPIPRNHLNEMIADWHAASRTKGKMTVKDWYAREKHKIDICDADRIYVEKMIFAR